MKQHAKSLVVHVLGWQVRRLRKKNELMIIGVVGSIGKTSTKFAVAQILKEAKVVRFQEGNYNDIVSVPLVFFGQTMPSLLNPFAWLRIFYRNERQLRRNYPYDVVVVELGTDAPGQISKFSRYLRCDIAIVTALTPEHMEFFKSMDAVAAEEMSVVNFSDKVILNKDLCSPKYYKNFLDNVITYGTSGVVDYGIDKVKTTRNGSKYVVSMPDRQLELNQDAFGLPEIYSAVAGVVAADLDGLTDQQIKHSVRKLMPVSGRMQRLEGIKRSLILDDTYNASPVAMKASLDILYAMKAPQKIAILGNMNEMGEHSKAAHVEVGNYCEPEQLDLVVTIGPDANEFLAPAAKKRGCDTQSFDNPYDAAEFIKSVLKEKAIILAKGSQNKVFAEEAVKLLLANPNDAEKLVRQSKQWMKKKRKNFENG